MKDVNSVTLMCRLTRDPELRSLPSGTSVCQLRVAFSTSRKNSATGQWEDRPNYMDVTVWGAQGESCDKYLSKGRQICVLGRLEWREWEDKQSGGKRQSIDIQAEQVQFVGGGRDDDGGGSGSAFTPRQQSDVPSDYGGGSGDFQPAAAGSNVPPPADDDIPF